MSAGPLISSVVSLAVPVQAVVALDGTNGFTVNASLGSTPPPASPPAGSVAQVGSVNLDLSLTLSATQTASGVHVGLDLANADAPPAQAPPAPLVPQATQQAAQGANAAPLPPAP